LLQQGTSFVCKLHGSVSSVETIVFSTRDYDSVEQNARYFEAVRSMFSSAVVLFLGYGLREEYVLRALQESVARPRLFGTGPHFIVTPEERSYLPETVRHVRYLAETKDHRDAIHVLEVIADFTPSPAIHTSDKNSVSTDRGKSIYFIADLIPY
jgi:hypothetical protein